MRARIKYIERDGVLYTDWFTIRANYIVRGVIRKSDLVYYIEELDTSRVLTGSTKNLRLCKDNLKNALINTGVKFNSEIRQTTP